MAGVDWYRKADPNSVQASMDLLRSRGPARDLGLESLTETAEVGSSLTECEQLDRLADSLNAKTAEAPDGDRADLAEKVLEGARTGLAKLNQGEVAQGFTLGEQMGLESVIITDGTRPSLLVQKGFVDLKSPDIGDWATPLQRFQKQIETLAISVGRIDVPVAPWFIGTCFVVAPGLVVTNRHVLEDIAEQGVSGAWTLKWPDYTTIDFGGEEGAPPGSGFKITGVAFAGLDPINRTINFAHLDMAVLRVDTASDPNSAFPAPVLFENDVAQPAMGRSLYLLGFPGKPYLWTGDGVPSSGFETATVLSTLFHNQFGVKRLAPGYFKAGPGEEPGDAKGWICAHDASTLAGCSGSCIVDLGFDGLRILGLHFGGVNRGQNWGHAASRLHDILKEFRATVAAGEDPCRPRSRVVLNPPPR
jgi:hypothetical protein